MSDRGDIVAGALRGGTDLIGAITSGLTSMYNARKANELSLYMSNTAHQREVRDLLKAGLNPILSATGGNGASTPVAQVADAPDLSRIGSSAVDAYMRRRELDVSSRQASANMLSAEASKLSAETNSEISSSTIEANSARSMLEANEAQKIALDNKITEINMPAIRAEAENRRRRAEYEHDSHTSSPGLNSFFSTLGRWSPFAFGAMNSSASLLNAGKGYGQVFNKLPNTRVRRPGFHNFWSR